MFDIESNIVSIGKIGSKALMIFFRAWGNDLGTSGNGSLLSLSRFFRIGLSSLSFWGEGPQGTLLGPQGTRRVACRIC